MMREMKNLCLKFTVAAVISCSIVSCSTSKKSAIVVSPVPVSVGIKTDSAYKLKPKSFYENIIKKGSGSGSAGFCRFHKADNKYYFEIPDSVFDKDILVVNRIVKAAAQVRPDNEYAGYGADQIGENIIQFSKGANNKVFIKKIEYSSSRSIDSSENGMYRAVTKSNLPPIMAAFDIQAWAPDSSSVLIDMTEYISGDNDLFFFSGQQKKVYNLSVLQKDRSYIEQVAAFPVNIELKTVKTYSNGNSSLALSLPYLTYELNTSMVLLPAAPMKTRLVDQRIGYFGRGYVDFDIPHPQGFNGTWLATRWRLEPKEEDIERYKKGELVEPQKPIIYYIDPATPKKWVPYLIKGVNAWQKAFEKAGFKNAIYALEAPVNDPSWSLEDARHSAIVYKASWVQNASGPNVNDPRTGEILEAHINWYHNVTEILRDWYFTQASPSDPAARKMIFDDSVMGKLITFVCSHEVGHTLGLAHNFASSSTVPVDSLRSKNWVAANGLCPSIMDYARFNYVAQPEDSMTEKELIPSIGPYDEWAIEWGYRWFSSFASATHEKEFLNQWVVKKLQDPRLLFTYGGARCQSEDLGDDAMKAGAYGIRNLERIMPQLLQWAKLPNENYDGVNKMEDQVVYQFKRYITNASKNIGGTYFTPKTAEQTGPVIEYVSREKQKAAVTFLQKELFTTPRWLFNEQLAAITGGNGYGTVLSLQKNVLNDILSLQTLKSLVYQQSLQPAKVYAPSQLLDDLESGIWAELQTNAPVDLYRRNLQKAYIAQLLSLQNTASNGSAGIYTSDLSMTDLLSVIKAHKLRLQKKITEALLKCKDEETKWHLSDVAARLKNTTDDAAGLQSSKNAGGNTIDEKNINNLRSSPVPSFDAYMQSKSLNCWSNMDK
ncbi:MAG: zinc-dependent metalloprotease [Ferruginibacter sp.]